MTRHIWDRHRKAPTNASQQHASEQAICECIRCGIVVWSRAIPSSSLLEFLSFSSDCDVEIAKKVHNS